MLILLQHRFPLRSLSLELATSEMYFDGRALRNESSREKSLIRLPNSPAIMASRIFVTEYHNEHCNRLKLLLQQKQARNNFEILNEENVAIADKLLEYPCISTKQHKFLLPKGLN